MKKNVLIPGIMVMIVGLFVAGTFIVPAENPVQKAPVPVTVASPGPGDDEATFYENTNYGGTSFTVSADVSDMRNISGVNWNDKVSSIKLGKNVCVKAFQDINYGGGAWWFTGNGLCVRNIPNLVDFGWNDKMSSFRITTKEDCGGAEPGENEVIFYEHKNFQGSSKIASVDNDVPDMRYWDGANWNDKVSSIKIGTNVCLTFWIDINYKGGKTEISGNQDCINDLLNLVNNGVNDKISSFKIRSKEIGCAKQ
ncbi:MAG: beta/gamma crystallin domain-containing protein [Bacteroidetes bacterium]|nr:beta/gamma crystallin domain-containing protein [Bacteroidota bacterium]